MPVEVVRRVLLLILVTHMYTYMRHLGIPLKLISPVANSFDVVNGMLCSLQIISPPPPSLLLQFLKFMATRVIVRYKIILKREGEGGICRKLLIVMSPDIHST